MPSSLSLRFKAIAKVWWVFTLKKITRALGLTAGGAPRSEPVVLASACSGVCAEAHVLQEGPVNFFGFCNLSSNSLNRSVGFNRPTRSSTVASS